MSFRAALFIEHHRKVTAAELRVGDVVPALFGWDSVCEVHDATIDYVNVCFTLGGWRTLDPEKIFARVNGHAAQLMMGVVAD